MSDLQTPACRSLARLSTNRYFTVFFVLPLVEFFSSIHLPIFEACLPLKQKNVLRSFRAPGFSRVTLNLMYVGVPDRQRTGKRVALSCDPHPGPSRTPCGSTSDTPGVTWPGDNDLDHKWFESKR